MKKRVKKLTREQAEENLAVSIAFDPMKMARLLVGFLTNENLVELLKPYEPHDQEILIVEGKS